MTSHPTIFIVGPTASGKSDLAHRLALKINACILNADSIQLYEGLEIGSAAPSLEEKQEVDHYLFQVIPKGKSWTASEYQEKAWEIVERELPRRPVVVVGGSGFYFQALERGMADSMPEDPRIKSQLEMELREEGANKLYDELKKVDPESAEKIHPNDHYRLLRALGYFRTFGTRFSRDQVLESARAWPGVILKYGLKGDQNLLRERILKRVEKMLAAGFENEVRGLVEEGFGDWRALQSVGYKEMVMMIKGELEPSRLLDEIVKKTLQLAKRQKTWFKRDPQIEWYEIGKNDQALTEILLKLS